MTQLTRGDVNMIVERLKTSVVALDEMVYEDARKEFSLAAMTGFGADGTRVEKELDFEQVRGDFESNPFVVDVRNHIVAKTRLGDELLERLSGIL